MIIGPMQELPYIILFIIGFLNALPLSGQTLSIYLTERGFDTNLIGLFCLLSFPMSIKIIWAPIIDHVTLPFFRSSPRKRWLLFSLLGIALSFAFLTVVDPAVSPILFAITLSALFSFAACLYMV